MSDEKFFYSKSGFAPYSDGSGFKVTVTLEQDTEDSDPTISVESVFRLPVTEWVDVSKRIERLLSLVTRKQS